MRTTQPFGSGDTRFLNTGTDFTLTLTIDQNAGNYDVTADISAGGSSLTLDDTRTPLGTVDTFDSFGFLQDDPGGEGFAVFASGSDVEGTVTDNNGPGSGNFGPAPIPEPSSSVLLLGGLLGLIFRRIRR